MAAELTYRAIPKPGRRVRAPETGEVVPEGGVAASRSSYWLRRERDGDVELVPPEPPPAEDHPPIDEELLQDGAP